MWRTETYFCQTTTKYSLLYVTFQQMQWVFSSIFISINSSFSLWIQFSFTCDHKWSSELNFLSFRIRVISYSVQLHTIGFYLQKACVSASFFDQDLRISSSQLGTFWKVSPLHTVSVNAAHHNLAVLPYKISHRYKLLYTIMCNV